MAKNPQGSKCGTCIFFEPKEKKKALGHCRRFPPQIVNHRGSLTEYFPDVRVDGWCGEYEYDTAHDPKDDDEKS